MKAYRCMISVLSLLVLVFMATSPLQADPGWYICKVNYAGPVEQGAFMNLSDVNGSFSDVWFLSVPGLEKDIRSLRFTALCNDMEVTIFADPDASKLYYIYLKKNN